MALLFLFRMISYQELPHPWKIYSSLSFGMCYSWVDIFGSMTQPLLPRTSAIKLLLISLKPGLDAFDSLPCLLFLVCLRDTFIPEGRKLRDQRRLYAPGRMYHIVERKFCRYMSFKLFSITKLEDFSTFLVE